MSADDRTVMVAGWPQLWEKGREEGGADGGVGGGKGGRFGDDRNGEAGSNRVGL